MNRANLYIDPVILRIDRRNEEILQMYGSAMMEVYDGHTYTHYSLHGNWLSDDFSKRQMIVPDAGSLVVRGSPISNGIFVIGNGIFQNGPLLSRHEWMDWRDYLIAAAQKPVRSPRKLTWKSSPSKFKIESMSSKQLSPNKLPT